MKIGHLIQDEKFPDSAYELFESVAPGASDYILVTDTIELKHLKQIKPVFIGFKESLGREFLSSLKAYDFVVIHGLSPIVQKIVWKADKSITFVWVGMGYDYYDLIYPDPDALLKLQTRSIKALLAIEKKESIHKKLIKKINIALGLQPKTKSELTKKIKYFAPVVGNEFELVKQACPESDMTFLDWNYGLTATLIESNKVPKELTGNNVLLGNSATFTNNHAEILSFLGREKALLDNRVVLTPLSYGDQGYKEYIIGLGIDALQEAFSPVEGFMRFDSYMSLLSSCSTVIMNHKRQQAGGSIAAALYMGAVVFLDENNAFYKEYKDAGVHIFSVRELGIEPTMINLKLNESEKQKNRMVIYEMRSRKTVRKKTEKLISAVVGYCVKNGNY